MTTTPEPGSSRSTVTVGEFLRVLGRHRALLLLTVLIALVAAVAFDRRMPASYQAAALVDITPPPGSGIAVDSVSTATQQQIVLSQQVANRAARELRDYTPAQVLAHVSVSSPQDSLVLEISFGASTANAAARGANAVAHAYISYVEAVGTAQLSRRASGVEARVADLRGQLAQLPKSSDQRGGLQSQISALQQQLNEIRATVVNSGQLVGPAVPPTSQSGAGLVVYLAGGLAFGLLLGVVLAVVRDRRADAIRSADDLERTLGQPVLAVVPQDDAGRRDGSRLSALTDAHGAEADAFRSLALKLSAAVRSGTLRHAQVIALVGGERAEQVPANLAVSMARGAQEVALAATNESAQHMRDALGAAIRDTAPRDRDRPALVRLVPLGEEIQLDGLLGGTHTVIDEVAEQVDIVLLDAVNVRQPSSRLSLARRGEASVLLARLDVTRHADVRELHQELTQLGVDVVGAVLLSGPKHGRLHPRRLALHVRRRSAAASPGVEAAEAVPVVVHPRAHGVRGLHPGSVVARPSPESGAP